ncbi:hypothetical protein K438DRAFT_1759912 [Mycena galopus ATCC 62051]|nr:hypothetical protein K438DRAFT_1759912 [Mycena galopus ATCC 62051]
MSYTGKVVVNSLDPEDHTTIQATASHGHPTSCLTRRPISVMGSSPRTRRRGANDSNGPFGSYMNQQIDFIERDLAVVDRSVTPWVVAAGHSPCYVDSGGCITCQEAFEPLLSKHGGGRRRLGLVAKNAKDPGGYNNPSAPVYLVNGAAGVEWAAVENLLGVERAAGE